MHNLADYAQSIANAYIPPPTGRPSDIGSEATVKELLEAVGAGNYLETACKLAGLNKVTVYNWIKRGQAGEAPYDVFVNALERAEARAESHMVSLVRKAAESGPQYWPSAATHLERRHPDRWGKRQDATDAPKVVVQIGGGSEVKVLVQVAEPVSPPTFAPDSPAEDSAKSLTGMAFALPSSPIRALMLTNEEACQVSVAPDRDNGRATPRGTQGGEGGDPAQSSAVPRQRRVRAGQKEKGV